MNPSPPAAPRGSRRARWLILFLLLALLGVATWSAVQSNVLRIYNPFDPVQSTAATIESLGGVVKTNAAPDGRRLYYVTLGSRYHGGDQGLKSLAALPTLDGVYIENGTITDEGAALLGQLTQLDELSLACPKITDAGVRSLSGLSKIRWLSLSGMPVTNQGLTVLAKLGSLEKLTLTGTQITDEGLVHVAQLSQLRQLWLDYTRVSDAGLVHLEPLENLTHLWADSSQITPAGAERLRAKRAGLEVVCSTPKRFTE